MNYRIFSDGASRGNPGHSGCGFVVYDEDNKIVHEGKRYIGKTTNNQAEYQALLIGLEEATKMLNRISQIDCYLDSELVVKQLNGEYRMKNKELKVHHDAILNIVCNRGNISFHHIPRTKNIIADKLANEAIDEHNNLTNAGGLSDEGKSTMGIEKIMGHNIEYSWFDDYTGGLDETDIDHIHGCLKEGYVEGELCKLDEEGEEQRGWWGKIKEEQNDDEVSIKIPRNIYNQLKDIQKELKTQNGRLAQNPAYEVRVIHQVPSDSLYSEDFEWVNTEDYEDIIEEQDVDEFFEGEEVKKEFKEFKEEKGYHYYEDDYLESLGYERRYFIREPKVVGIFLTEKAAQDYIDTHAHNLNEPFIFGTYLDKNDELLLVRNLILNLK